MDKENIFDKMSREEYIEFFGNLKSKSTIKDSGNRREFESGAVRDMAEGKGRCDLLPLDVVAEVMLDDVICDIAHYLSDNDDCFLRVALDDFCNTRGWDKPTMTLEVAKHFEEGAKKYGEHNWEKGLPETCYIDSAIRHYLKWLRGDEDEPHDRAFVWNILALLWTRKHIKKECANNGKN